MPITYPSGYYNRFDAQKNYDQHLFRAGDVLQSAEMNEIQSAAHNRLRGVADAIFKDGDIIRDARIVVNPDTGETRCESGALYLKGAVHGVSTATLNIPIVGVVSVGVYLREYAVSEIDDPELRDPATGTRNYRLPGAWRLRSDTAWGYPGDGQPGEYYPVYTVEDGILRAKEPPPNLDGVTQALARYDRDSAGGSYVVSGLYVSMAADLEDGRQVYTVAEGRARVFGYGVEQPASRRLIYAATPDLRAVDSEPHTSTTAGAQRVNLDRTPLGNVPQVRITAEKTVTLTHGGYLGCKDPLPDTSVLLIVEVKQGATTYIQGTDYKLTGGQVDWELPGAEVATGSAYTVKYQYITTATPTAIDDDGFTVSGAVAGSLILCSYVQKLPRIDRLAISSEGELIWIPGVAADWNPQSPPVPAALLPLALVYQTWRNDRRVVNDGVRMVPMPEISALSGRLDHAMGLIAQQRLESDIHMREAGTKKGLFVDPFLDDSQRDAGLAQSAAVIDGELTLPVAASVNYFASDITAPTTLAFSLQSELQQPARTGSMKINPYMAFAPVPASITLIPAIDRWTEVETSAASAITRRFVVNGGVGSVSTWESGMTLVGQTQKQLENLRQIDVRFIVSGFGPNETLSTFTFDGLNVTVTAV